MPILNVENIASTVDITTNGLKDVAQYTTANVDVQPVISSLNVTPTTSAQTITAPAGTDGYSPVNVSAVTSSIDANITAGNIKDGVTILGVTGSYQGGGGAQESGLLITGTVENGELQDITTVKTVGITDISGSNIFDNAVTTFFAYSFDVDLSSLTNISGEGACAYMFVGSQIKSLDLSSLTTVSGYQSCFYMFSGCGGFTSVSLSSLTAITGEQGCAGMFQGCTDLMSADLSSLTTVSGQSACNNMFADCPSLETISFPAITTQSFGEYTDQFVDMVSGCENVTIHFPSNLQSVVSGLDGYPDFGGTNTTLLFDLTATS